MYRFIQIIGIAALTLLAGSSRAELVYSWGQVRDTDSHLSWKYFKSLTEGQSLGYSPATVGQTSELFLHYAPPDSGGVLPGYTPTPGWRVVDYITSGDGMMFSLSWQDDYYYQTVFFPPSFLDSFGYTSRYFSAGAGAVYERTILGALVADDTGWVPVKIESSYDQNHYGYVWGTEKGIINPGVADAIGASGYLMVRSIPEPSISTLMLLGIGGLGLLARHRARG